MVAGTEGWGPPQLLVTSLTLLSATGSHVPWAWAQRALAPATACPGPFWQQTVPCFLGPFHRRPAGASARLVPGASQAHRGALSQAAHECQREDVLPYGGCAFATGSHQQTGLGGFKWEARRTRLMDSRRWGSVCLIFSNSKVEHYQL